MPSVITKTKLKRRARRNQGRVKLCFSKKKNAKNDFIIMEIIQGR